MPLYITVSRGVRADIATPILASSDRHVVGAVLQTLARLDEWDQEETGETGRIARQLLDAGEDDDASD